MRILRLTMLGQRPIPFCKYFSDNSGNEMKAPSDCMPITKAESFYETKTLTQVDYRTDYGNKYKTCFLQVLRINHRASAVCYTPSSLWSCYLSLAKSLR